MGICSSELDKARYENTPEVTYTFTRAKVIKVYDGDTFWIAAKHNGSIHRFKARLYGVDCPEIRDKDPLAFLAKEYIERLLLGHTINIQVLNNTRYEGRLQREKYGRLLAIVKYKNVCINDRLLELGYAKKMGPGGSKSPLDKA